MSVKFAVITFPGSNCDMDCTHVVRNILHEDVYEIWHKESTLPEDIDCVILPGGFSYGDYLRSGAIARYSEIMKDIIRFAKEGGPVLGICNGFQVLVESELLPGALLKNTSLKFICRHVNLRVENNNTPYTSSYKKGEIIRIPIAHMEGNFFADDSTLKTLNKDNRVIFRYCDENGNITKDANPNGSLENIAGIISESGNVLGMMPHPERISESILGGEDGFKLFQSVRQWIINKKSGE